MARKKKNQEDTPLSEFENQENGGQEHQEDPPSIQRGIVGIEGDFEIHITSGGAEIFEKEGLQSILQIDSPQEEPSKVIIKRKGTRVYVNYEGVSY